MSYDDAEHERQLVRPYFLTQGRTEPDAQMPIEAIVRTARQPVVGEWLSVEQLAIVDLCVEPVAIAEVSAALHLPIGVTRVLVGDLAASGLVEVSAPMRRFDHDFFDEMIAGVRRAAAS
jgi:Protein of unknown function (DUF742)